MVRRIFYVVVLMLVIAWMMCIRVYDGLDDACCLDAVFASFLLCLTEDM